MTNRFYLTENRIVKSFKGFVNEDFAATGAPVDTHKQPHIAESTVDSYFKALSAFSASKQTLEYQPHHIGYSKDVENVQAGLNYLGYKLPKYGIDGLLGPETSGVLKQYQTDHKLAVSGSLDSATTDSLISELKTKDFDQAKMQQYLGDQQNAEKGVALLNDPAFISRLKEVADNIGTDSINLAKVMWAESRLDPTALEKRAGASGLIGFMPFTATALGTSTFELRKMSAVQQLEYVEKYFEKFKGRLKTLDDLYLVTFYPSAVGKADDYVVGSDRSDEYAKKVADQNPAIAKGKPYVTKADFHEYVSRIDKSFPHSSLFLQSA